jgi:hypothetical protein
MSHDSEEYPVLAWKAMSSKGGGDATCVCVPNDSGFTVAEDIPELADAARLGVARDRWGDAWVAWYTLSDGMFFIHSHTVATSSAPRFANKSLTPRLTWTLSEPAPKTWWAVQRAVGDGEFDVVGHARAGPDLNLTFSDSTAPRDAMLRFRIRRESVDKRYEWLSDEATWWPRVTRLILALKGGRPVADVIEFSVTGSGSGVLEPRLYDLQGRLVASERIESNGSGRDSSRFNISGVSPSLRNGIYFLRVHDGAGHVSNAVKVVVVR